MTHIIGALSFGTCENEECKLVHFYINLGEAGQSQTVISGSCTRLEAEQLRDQLQIAIGEREMGAREPERKPS